MPEVDGSSVISQLSQIVAPKKIPVILIVDRPVPSVYNNVRLLGRENWAKLKHPYAIDVLVREIIKFGGKAGDNKNKEG
jgi:hypothetical protein